MAPYHVYVPSFGEWGFALAAPAARTLPTTLPEGLRFLTPGGLAELFHFPRDMDRVDVEPNRLHTQALVRYYEREWGALTR